MSTLGTKCYQERVASGINSEEWGHGNYREARSSVGEIRPREKICVLVYFRIMAEGSGLSTVTLDERGFEDIKIT